MIRIEPLLVVPLLSVPLLRFLAFLLCIVELWSPHGGGMSQSGDHTVREAANANSVGFWFTYG